MYCLECPYLLKYSSYDIVTTRKQVPSLFLLRTLIFVEKLKKYLNKIPKIEFTKKTYFLEKICLSKFRGKLYWAPLNIEKSLFVIKSIFSFHGYITL